MCTWMPLVYTLMTWKNLTSYSILQWKCKVLIRGGTSWQMLLLESYGVHLTDNRWLPHPNWSLRTGMFAWLSCPCALHYPTSPLSNEYTPLSNEYTPGLHCSSNQKENKLSRSIPLNKPTGTGSSSDVFPSGIANELETRSPFSSCQPKRYGKSIVFP